MWTPSRGPLSFHVNFGKNRLFVREFLNPKPMLENHRMSVRILSSFPRLLCPTSLRYKAYREEYDENDLDDLPRLSVVDGHDRFQIRLQLFMKQE